MKKNICSALRASIVLLILTLLPACVPPTPQSEPTPQGLLSFDDLTAKLDSLQGPSARSLTVPGASILTTVSGSSISFQDLITYLNYLKQAFGSEVKKITSGLPYHVVPMPVLDYPSVDANGNRLSLSGLMWVPFTWGRHLAAPFISLQHGAQVFRSCAPSQFDPNPLLVFLNKDQSGALQNYIECIVGGLMASAGNIVLMPDYPGFGVSDAPHPFVHTSLGNSVRDFVVAARARLTGAVTSSGKLFLTGFSEGGYATMAGAKVVTQAGIQVTGAVPCDGSYDLSGVMLSIMLYGQLNGQPFPVEFPWYLLWLVYGYHSVYGNNPFDYNALLNPPYNTETPELFDGNHTDAQLSATVPPVPTPPGSYMLTPAGQQSAAQSGAVYNCLLQNDGYTNWPKGVPIVFVHCPQDEVEPLANAQVAAGVLNAPIVPVQPLSFVYQVFGSYHVAAYAPAMLAAFTAIETMNRGY